LTPCRKGLRQWAAGMTNLKIARISICERG
jgi:hypothetical protein